MKGSCRLRRAQHLPSATSGSTAETKTGSTRPVSERYNYLYSEDELKEFLPPIKALSAKTSTLFVFFNNCHAGSAAKNAVMLAKMLLEPGA